MPKGNDPLCPLGFHPQTRWPNRCKRCFRDYNDHKSVKDQSGSTTSLNSLSSYDPTTKDKEEQGTYRRTRSDLSAELISRANNDTTSSGTENHHDRRQNWTTPNSSKSWNKSRPVSWSAQDLRAAVDEAKEQVRSSREDLHRLYGSTKSLTANDYGSYGDLRGSASNLSSSKEDKDGVPYSSFSSYLAMRTKSPARPPLSRSSSLQPETARTRESEDEERAAKTRTQPETRPEARPETSSSIPPSLPSVSESRKEGKEGKKEGKEGKKEGRSLLSLSLLSDAKPPKPPTRLRPSLKLLEIKETPTTTTTTTEENKPKKNILSLKGESNSTISEVKSEDESVDASYVIKLKPKPKEPKRVEIDLNSEVDRLQKELKERTRALEETREKCETLERENRELLAKKPKFGDLRKQAELSKVQQKVDELAEEVKMKNKEIKELKKEIDKRPLPKDVEKTMEDLRSKLQAAEQLCEELMDETEEYKKEIRALEEEIEEMQDNFREEQADEYRDLKRELEQTAKNCRVLQFKLKKAERRSDSLERDKTEIEEKLKELQVGEGDLERAEKVKVLEKEVNLAKEVSMKMHEEMEKMKQQLETAEKDKKMLSEKVLDKPIKPGGKLSRAQMMGRQGSQDNTDQLMRDLQDLQERENDLKDQLKFAEEETKNSRKKISRLEEENETLALQLKKMSTKAKQHRQRSMERTGSTERSSSVEKGSLSRQGSTEKAAVKEPDEGITEDLDPTELKIQLELNEQEASVLRRKIEDLETENDRLQKEIRGVLGDKKNESGTDHKRLEKEVEVLKTRTEETERENERLQDENKKLQLKTLKRLPLSTSESGYIERQVMEEKVRRLEKKLKESNEKLKSAQINMALETDGKGGVSCYGGVGAERDELRAELDRRDTELAALKKKSQEIQEKYEKMQKTSDAFKKPPGVPERTPKVAKDFTPKATLIKWVNELEDECSKLHTALAETDKRRKSRTNSEDITNTRDLHDKLEREKERNEELTRQLKEEREKLDKTRRAGREDDVKKYEDKISSLKNELEKERDRNEDLRGQLKEGKDRMKLQKELTSSQETVSILERKLKETEETLRGMERTERKSKQALEKLETKLEEEKTLMKTAEARNKEMNLSWLKERDVLKKELQEDVKLREKAEKDLKAVKKAKESLESRLEEEKRKAEETITRKSKESDNIQKLKSEREEMEIEIEELKESISQLEKSKEKLSAKHKKDTESYKKEKEDMNIRMSTLESELKTEQRKRERMEKETGTMKERNNAKSEAEVAKVKEELDHLRKEHRDLEKQRAKEKKERELLQTKYDLLEEDYVVQKAQFTTNSEGKQEEFEKLKRDYETINTELRTLRDTYNHRQDTWIKEKLSMQDQLRDLDQRLNKASNDPTSYSEKKRLKDIIEDKNQQLDQLRRDEDSLKDQVSYYRRESEDLRRKVEDLEKLVQLNDKRASNLASDTTNYDNIIKDLRTKLAAAEKTHKSELTKLKMKYDSKIKNTTEESITITSHMNKYRRERDTYKEMVDGLQRTVAELKAGGSYRASRADNANEAHLHLVETQELHSQVTDLEDKLADARLENTKIKNQLTDVKTNFEIQLCDMQTKLNEYEEDRLLGGGSRRVPGLRTRLELNWQKEREEQQRLIQETATLAKDLRQTLYEVERERDLEKLEAKRKIDQLKKTVGQETTDTKSKVQELQRDLLELREAHAKLRQINEKLRREKDRTEVEREAMRDKFLGSSREHLNQQTKMERLIEEMKSVKDLAPLVLGEGLDGKDTAMTKLPGDAKPKTKEEFTESLKKACKTVDDIKRMMNLLDDKDRLKRASSFRRALSDMESEDEGLPLRPRSQNRGMIHRGSKARSSLYRKTQSLDHQLAEERNKIWVSTDAGSTTSIDSTMTDDLRKNKYDSMDRISTGSQTSDLDALGDNKKKKKKGMVGIISKLTKSRSIEESSTGDSIVGAGVKAMGVGVGGSGSDLPGEVEKEGRVKGRLKSLFKSGPPTRSQSMDRNVNKDGPNVKTIASNLESDAGSINSMESDVSLPTSPARRFRHRSNISTLPKAHSTSTLGRQSSFETEV